MLAASVAESGWLAALVVVPIFFNTNTVRIFEEEKVALLRSIGVLIATSIIVWIAEVGRSAWRPAGHSLWRLPLVLPAFALTAAYGLSTAVSIAPGASFWGAYVRCQGTYTWLSYIVVFLAVVLLVRQRQQVDRVATILLLGSVPPAVYGVLQHFGLDPLPWASDATARVYGTAGNPIFLAGYLIMVVPVTLARVIEQLTAARRWSWPPAGGRARLSGLLLLGAYLSLLFVQLVSIVYSQSRGPFLGLAVGLTFFFVVLALHRRLRWLTVTTAALVAAGGLFLAVFNLPATPLQGLRSVPYVGRLGELTDIGQGTGKVRALIWQGATQLLASNPGRALTGYGPETMFLAYPRFYPVELGHYESRGAAPDRSHNETFDALITTGVVGLVAQLVVFLSFFLHVLRWLGMIETLGQRRAFVAAVTVGGTVGALAPYVFDGSLRFAGVGLPAGITVGIVAYLLGYAFTHLDAPPQPARRDDLLLIALLAGVMAHFIEIHFGIAVAATRLYFWLYAGLAVAVGMPLVDAATTDTARPQESAAAPLLSGNLVAVTPIVGLILILLTFSFWVRGVDVRAHAPALCVLGGSVWLLGALLVGAEPGAAYDWLARLAGYAATSAGIWLLFVAVYAPAADRGATATDLGAALVAGVPDAKGVGILYAFVFLTVGLNALVAALRQRPLPRVALRQPWVAVACPMLAAGTFVIIVSTNLDGARADTLSKQGERYERRQQWDAARVVYQEALRLRPGEDRYATKLGRVLVEKARRDLGDQPAERDRRFEEAVAVLQRAQRISPLDMDVPRNLAKTYRAWAVLSEEPNARSTRIGTTEAYYREALDISPHNASLWAEWATLHLELRQPERALEILDRALQVDERYTTTHWLRATAHLQLGQIEAAVSDYDRALAVEPNLLPAWSGKAKALADLGRFQEAIEASRQALLVAPDDLITRRNLALLYQRSGELDLALQEAQAALRVAQGDEVTPLSQFVEELKAQR